MLHETRLHDAGARSDTQPDARQPATMADRNRGGLRTTALKTREGAAKRLLRPFRFSYGWLAALGRGRLSALFPAPSAQTE